MSYGTVLAVERAVRDVALHMVQHVLVERLQRLCQRARGLRVEGVDSVREHEIHVVKYCRLSVLAVVGALRVSALRND